MVQDRPEVLPTMRSFLPLLALACAPKPAPAPAVPEGPDLDAPLPFDPAVRHGTLDNGLRWFVEVNQEPRDRVVMRLVLDAGSALEDDDQRGLAHLLEHMAFNGTEHFPGNDLIVYLEGIGARFGPHLNAHTSFDETVYKLTVPTDDPEVLATAYQVLEDWAHGLTLDPEEIDKERGVVIEEWRTRLTAGGRVFEQTAPLLYHDARYAERLPIGTKESLETFDHEAVQRFYRDWYRPSLMSVVVVGDIDPDAAEAAIRTHFEGLRDPEPARERTRFDIPDHEATLYGVITDPEVTRASVSVTTKHDDVESNTERGYRESLVEGLAYRIVNARLSERGRLPDAPFLGAGAGPRRLGPAEGSDRVGVAVQEDGVLEGLRAVWTEVERLRRHGVQAGELERARDQALATWDHLDKERDTTDSASHAGELVRHALQGETVPGIDTELAIAQSYLPRITVDDLNAFLTDWMPPRSRVVTAVLPGKEGLTPPTEAELAAVLAEVEAADVAPLPDEEALPEHLVEVPAPGTVAETDDRYLEALGFRGWVLSNGVRVYARDTDFKVDDVRWRSFAPGGTALVADDAWVPTVTADNVLYASGFGALDRNRLQRWLAGRTARAGHWMSTEHHGTWGTASPDDLDVALEMLHASLVAPRFTDDGFAWAQRQQTEGVRNRLASPDTAFGDAWNALLWPDDPRHAPWTLDTVARMDAAASADAWARFQGDQAGATYVFVGALPDDFEAQVLTWLGSLPAAAPLDATARGLEPARGPLETTVAQGMAERARVKIAWHAPFPDADWLTRNRLFALGGVLRTRLREELREERGGVYGVSASGSTWDDPDWGLITVSFTCDPGRVDELVDAVHEVVDTMVEAPVEARYVDQLKEQNRREREESVRDNGFWLSSFAGALERGDDPAELLTWDARNDSLDPDAIHEAAKRWLTGPDRVQVVLTPEATEVGPTE